VRRIRRRTRFNRRGVTVPFRVLPDSEVAGCLGCPLPVRPRRPLNARSCRSSFLRPRPWMRLLGQSSPGVRSSYTVCPEVSAAGLSTGGTSRGFLPLQRSRRRESTSVPVARDDPPVLPECPPADPNPRTTVSLTGFPNLSATSSSPHRPAIFRRVAFLGFALQGFVPSTKPRRLVAAGMPS
jgi:hypothetical protein